MLFKNKIKNKVKRDLNMNRSIKSKAWLWQRVSTTGFKNMHLLWASRYYLVFLFLVLNNTTDDLLDFSLLAFTFPPSN